MTTLLVKILRHKGTFPAVFDDETTEEHALDEVGVQVTGYDAHKEGRQTISEAIVV